MERVYFFLYEKKNSLAKKELTKEQPNLKERKNLYDALMS